LVLLVLGAAPPVAQADTAQARIHFERGRTFFEIDEYRKAIEEFKAAHVEKADPAFLYNIAECYRHLGENREALTYYRRFLSLAPANDRSRPAVEKRIAELQALADRSPPLKQAKDKGAAGRPSSSGGPAIANPVETSPATTPADSAPARGAPTLAFAPAASSTALVGAGPGTAPTIASAPPDEPKPFYKRAWFFAAAGAVLAAGAVALWAASRGPDVPGTPLGNQSAFQ
jgi:tetratricopeptide (TPR) repeat protein